MKSDPLVTSDWPSMVMQGVFILGCTVLLAVQSEHKTILNMGQMHPFFIFRGGGWFDIIDVGLFENGWFNYETVRGKEASLAIADGNSKTCDKFHRKINKRMTYLMNVWVLSFQI